MKKSKPGLAGFSVRSRAVHIRVLRKRRRECLENQGQVSNRELDVKISRNKASQVVSDLASLPVGGFNYSLNNQSLILASLPAIDLSDDDHDLSKVIAAKEEQKNNSKKGSYSYDQIDLRSNKVLSEDYLEALDGILPSNSFLRPDYARSSRRLVSRPARR